MQERSLRPPTRTEISDALLAHAAALGAGKTFCPSEVARALSPDWRPLMPDIRAAAAGLAASGTLRVTQKGAEVDALQVRGPIRIGLR